MLKNKNIYNFMIILICFYCFCVWGSAQNPRIEDQFYLNNKELIEKIDTIVRYALYIIFFIFSNILLIKKNNIFLYLISIILFLQFLITRNTDLITAIITLFTLKALIENTKYINKKLIKKFCYIYITGIIIQLSLFKYFGRRVLAVLDPNYSAYILFLFFILLDKVKLSFLKWLVLFMGFFMLSRNYILGVVLYFLLKIPIILKISKKILKKIFRNNAIIVSLSIFFVTIFIGYVFLRINHHSNYEYGASRLLTINDDSNYLRFEQYFSFFKALKEYDILRNFGLTDIEYRKIPYIKVNPHNPLLVMIRSMGIYIGCIVYFSTIQLLFRKKITKYITFAIPLLIYQTFFLALYVGLYIMLVGVIVSFIKYENELEKIEFERLKNV